jgi:Lar family restriction alleviation protein
MNNKKNGMLPCPHCGSRPLLIIRDASSERVYQVICKNLCLQEHDTRKEAIDIWNKRITYGNNII